MPITGKRPRKMRPWLGSSVSISRLSVIISRPRKRKRFRDKRRRKKKKFSDGKL